MERVFHLVINIKKNMIVLTWFFKRIFSLDLWYFKSLFQDHEIDCNSHLKWSKFRRILHLNGRKYIFLSFIECCSDRQVSVKQKRVVHFQKTISILQTKYFYQISDLFFLAVPHHHANQVLAMLSLVLSRIRICCISLMLFRFMSQLVVEFESHQN